ncbi:MAG: SLC13 family permease, partial [Candidatus Aquilonibacter sp.]
MTLTSWLVIAISLGAVMGMILRPKRSQEWVWAVAAAALLTLVGAIAPRQAWQAILRGTDVYAFLIGIMALAELARHEGLFDWLASHALAAAGGSQRRLFGLLFVVGAGV